MITTPNLPTCGRLGNQMFQLATAYAHAVRYGHMLGVPSCFLTESIKDNDAILVGAPIDPETESWNEPSFTYTQIPAPTPRNVFAIRGYFQSEKYFEGTDVAALMQPSAAILEQAESVTRKFGSNLVLLSVRRGDYVPKQDYHPLQTHEYYEQATAQFPGADFLVFSDDIPWCRENLRLPNLQFAEGFDPWMQMWMQTFCQHFIISNSTFAWWGAWLSKSPGKKIIAPRRWFGPASGLEDKIYDLIRPGWTLL